MIAFPCNTDLDAVFAEFEDDTEALRALRSTHRHTLLRLATVRNHCRSQKKTCCWSDFLHEAQRLRDARTFVQDYNKAAAPYIEKGFTVLRPNGFPNSGRAAAFPHLVESTDLQTPAGQEVPIDLIESAPQLWVLEMCDYNAFYVKATGEEVDEFAVDWDTEDQIEATAAKGLLHVDEVEVLRQFSPAYRCIDHGAAGLQLTKWAKASRSVPLPDRV